MHVYLICRSYLYTVGKVDLSPTVYRKESKCIGRSENEFVDDLTNSFLPVFACDRKFVIRECRVGALKLWQSDDVIKC